jgi:hypothetical protein
MRFTLKLFWHESSNKGKANNNNNNNNNNALIKAQQAGNVLR